MRHFLSNFKKKGVDWLPEMMLFLIFAIIQALHIHIDFWNDELYTLKKFVLVPFYKTITDYHAPNNHLFFNLLNNAYLKIIGISSLDDLLGSPYKLRFLPFIYALFTGFFTYKVGQVFFKKSVGLLAVALLATTIPYYNFSLQIRGYGLSTLLLVMVIYYTLCYLKQPQRLHLYKIALLTTLTIYTIPSNLYPIFGILAFLGTYALLVHRQAIVTTNQHLFDLKPIFASPPFYLILAIIAGIVGVLGLYSWIFSDVFGNAYVESSTYFQFSQLTYYVPNIWKSFVSNRWLLIPFVLLGFAFGRKHYQPWRSALWLLFAVCIVPMILVYIRGDQAPLRVFTVLMPLCSLLLALGLSVFWKMVFQNGENTKSELLFISVITLYALFIFKNETDAIADKLHTDIQTNQRTQNLYHQYYSAHYQPLADVQAFEKQPNKAAYPLVIHGCEPHGISYYLEKFKLPYYPDGAFDSMLRQHDTLFIVTSFPNRFTQKAAYKTDFISPKITYHNFLLYQRHHDDPSDTSYTPLYFNDFEPPWASQEAALLSDSLYAHSGRFSQKLDSSNVYSTVFAQPFHTLNSPTIKFSLKSRFEKRNGSVIVLEAKRQGKNVLWQSINIDEFYVPQVKQEWQSITGFFKIDKPLQADDLLKAYIWTPQKQTIWIDDFKLETQREE